MRVAVGLVLCMLMACIPAASAQFDPEQLYAWPGDPVDSHVHMTWAALTMEVNEWADDYPEIVDLTSAGESELGKTLWVVRLSDWSMDTKPNGSAKEIIYIDGGHHGNEYLGTALAWLSAKWYINGWVEGNEEAITVLQNTELHILIMLNPDGNDFDTRWNINQVDLNRNYDHYWNTCPTTQPGSSAFSEAETAANAAYINAYVTDADLYVTMHTGVWIILYPWGKWPEQPPDWELFWRIRDDVQANISKFPFKTPTKVCTQTAVPAETTATVRWVFPPSPSKPMTSNLSPAVLRTSTTDLPRRWMSCASSSKMCGIGAPDWTYSPSP